MKHIEVKLLNPEICEHSERMMVMSARLTQRGADITCMDDLEALYTSHYLDTTVAAMANLPHSTIKRFGKLDFAIVGASRRFLGQIRTHQVGIHFVSGSLQYSDYSIKARFCTPYEILKLDHDAGKGVTYETEYQKGCKEALDKYETLIKEGVPHDAAAYVMPQGLRNVLIMSVEPLELAHIIEQRACNRNSLETQYVVLKMWEQVYGLHKVFNNCGPACNQNKMCPEGRMSCGNLMTACVGPDVLLKELFPLLVEEVCTC